MTSEVGGNVAFETLWFICRVWKLNRNRQSTTPKNYGQSVLTLLLFVCLELNVTKLRSKKLKCYPVFHILCKNVTTRLGCSVSGYQYSHFVNYGILNDTKVH